MGRKPKQKTADQAQPEVIESTPAEVIESTPAELPLFEVKELPDTSNFFAKLDTEAIPPVSDPLPEAIPGKRGRKKKTTDPVIVEKKQYLSDSTVKRLLEQFKNDVLLSEKEVEAAEVPPITEALNSILSRHLQNSGNEDTISLIICLSAFTLKHGEKRISQLKKKIGL